MSGWVFLLLILIWHDTSAIREHKEEEAKRAEELRKQAEERRVQREEEERCAARQREEEAKEKAFWKVWDTPLTGGLSYWQMHFENGPEDYNDEYFDEFDEMFGPEWRRYLGVPLKRGSLSLSVQFQPWRAAS